MLRLTDLGGDASSRGACRAEHGWRDSISIEGAKESLAREKNFEDEDCKIEIVSLVYVGVAVEHLMLRLDYLDGRKRGIWDLGVPRLDPFRACIRYINRCIQGGNQAGSIMHSFFVHFGDGTQAKQARLIRRIQCLGYDLAAQNWWRSLRYYNLPVSMTQWVNPLIPEETRNKDIEKTYASMNCCVDAACTQKVQAKWPTAVAAQQSKELKAGLTTLSYEFPFTNMCMERLLAAMRRAVDGGMRTSELEATCSKGFLCQVLTEHLKRGGASPSPLQSSPARCGGRSYWCCGEKIRDVFQWLPTILQLRASTAEEEENSIGQGCWLAVSTCVYSYVGGVAAGTEAVLASSGESKKR